VRHSFSESNSYAGVDYVTASCLGLCTQIDNDPATTNDVNIAGFFEYVSSPRDAKVKRFVYAASSSTYGDSEVVTKSGRRDCPFALCHYEICE
jgi:UDP-N-acetylglucosamine 4-epimerase